ncbi:MAG TPA: cytochrome c [Vicinamibacteria bacterium]|nr:cytochrome c [Vicinamibacteria bacterium]
MRVTRLLSFALVGGVLALGTVVKDAPAQASRRQPAPAERQKLPAAAPPVGNLAHGQYLVERVLFCVECHSPRDGEGNIIAAEAFMGGPVPFRPPWPNDWALRAPRNRGLPGYTPELGIRLLTMGAVDRDGNQLRPPMPRFRLSPQDAADVVAYMMSLK